MSKQQIKNVLPFPLQIFAFSWGIAHLFHYSRVDFIYSSELSFFQNLLPCTVVSLAIALVLFPQNVKLLLSLSFFQILELFIKLPEVPNHWLFTGMINIIIFVELISKCTSSSKISEKFKGANCLQIDPYRLLRKISILGGLLYFFAFLAKVNSAHLNPAISCASIFFNNISTIHHLEIKGESLGWYLLLPPIIIELLFAIGLTLRRFTFLICVTALTFHFGLGFDLIKFFINFSSVMFAILIASFDKSFFEILEKRVLTKFSYKKFTLFSFTLIALYIVSQPVQYLYGVDKHLAILFLMWLIYAFTVFSLLGLVIRYFSIRDLFRSRPVDYYLQDSNTDLDLRRVEEDRGGKTCGRLPQLTFMVIIALVFLNGFGPYLGYKTRGAWQMYSNLRIENNFSNHYFFNSPQIVSRYQEKYGTIKSMNDPFFQYIFVRPNLKIPLIEIIRAIENPRINKMEFSYDGKDYSLNATNKKDLIDQFRNNYNYFEKKFLWFLPFGETAETQCLW